MTSSASGMLSKMKSLDPAYLAMIYGAIFGAVGAGITCSILWRWVNTVSLPISLALPYFAVLILANIIAGVCAVSMERGPLIGTIAHLFIVAGFDIYVRLSGAYSISGISMAQTGGLRAVHSIGYASGAFGAYTGWIGTWIMFKVTGQRMILPSLTPGYKNGKPTHNKYLADNIVTGVITTLLFIVWMSYMSQITNNSANYLIAYYCWFAGDDRVMTPGRLDDFLTPELSTYAQNNQDVRNALQPDILRSIIRYYLSSYMIGDYQFSISGGSDGRPTEVLVPITSGGTIIPDGYIDYNDTQITFYVVKVNGKWRISYPPKVYYPVRLQ